MNTKTRAEIIKIENLTVVYPNGTTALDDINISLAEGQIIGLVGANGAGKSTLFKSIMGLLKPTSGRVLVLGQPVKVALKKNLIAYVPQIEEVDWNFPILVEDLVFMGRYCKMGFFRKPHALDIAAMEDALAKVDMQKYRKTQIGELSGGQKKRIFVARALAQESKIILLDEPFAGVDIKTENYLIDLFKVLVQDGKLILVSTHNLGSIPHLCDQVILIKRKILAQGSIEETFTPEYLAQTFGGMLRHNQILSSALHDDEDDREITVVTDDERPLVLYGQKGDGKIVTPDPKK